MRRSRGWTGLAAWMIALGVVAAAAGGAQASPVLLNYDTLGSTISTTGTTGLDSGAASPIQFVPATGGFFLSPSSFSLGAFQASALADGKSVTYNNTPFNIKLTADQLNSQSGFQPNETPISISGVLNGTLSGANQSTVVATFTNPGDPGYTFATGLYQNTMKISDSPLTIVPSTTNNGLTTAQAVLTASSYTAPVPEPATMVLFAATIAGFGLRRKLRRAS